MASEPTQTYQGKHLPFGSRPVFFHERCIPWYPMLSKEKEADVERCILLIFFWKKSPLSKKKTVLKSFGRSPLLGTLQELTYPPFKPAYLRVDDFPNFPFGGIWIRFLQGYLKKVGLSSRARYHPGWVKLTTLDIITRQFCWWPFWDR